MGQLLVVINGNIDIHDMLVLMPRQWLNASS